MTGQEFGPGVVKVDIGRASAIASVMSVVLFGLLVAGSVYAAVDTDDSAVTVVGFVFASLFAIPLLLVLLGLRRLFAPRGLAFDAAGMHYWHGPARGLLRWDEVVAAGIGYEQPPDVPSLNLTIQDAIKDYVEDKIKDAVKLDGKRRIALEIFPVSTEGHPDLLRYRREDGPPVDGLPRVRYRILLPPVIGVARSVSRGVQTFQPQRWLGWFARPWRGGWDPSRSRSSGK